MSTEQKLEQEIQTLDAEAREALDKLADRREELERQHQGTALAAERQREREEERRREEERKASEKEEARRLEELDRLGKERLALQERAEAEVGTLIATLEELLAFDQAHRRALAPEGLTVHDAPPDFARELRAWFLGRFNRAVPGIGFDYRATGSLSPGPGLPERDPLTPAKPAER